MSKNTSGFTLVFGFTPSENDSERRKIEILLIKRRIKGERNYIEVKKEEQSNLVEECIKKGCVVTTATNGRSDLDDYDNLKTEIKESLDEIKMLKDLVLAKGYTEIEMDGFE